MVATPLPDSEAVKLAFGFMMNDDAADLVVEDEDGKVVFKLRFDRRDLGDLLSGRYGVRGELRKYGTQPTRHTTKTDEDYVKRAES